MMPDGHFTNVWMITEDGLQWLEGANDVLLLDADIFAARRDQ